MFRVAPVWFVLASSSDVLHWQRGVVFCTGYVKSCHVKSGFGNVKVEYGDAVLCCGLVRCSLVWCG